MIRNSTSVTAAFENSDDATEFIKCKIESMVASYETPKEGKFTSKQNQTVHPHFPIVQSEIRKSDLAILYLNFLAQALKS